MNKWIAAIGISFAILAGCAKSLNQNESEPSADPLTIKPDLMALPDGGTWTGSIDKASLVEKDGKAAIEINEVGVNLIWLDGFEFTEGEIEFDAKGKSEPAQNGFVGIAFWVENEVVHDAVYFRPFNFRAEDARRKLHAVQYISSPLWPWQRLREEFPGKYEKPIEPAPDGDEWFHARIVVKDGQIKVFVNGADEPSLAVASLNDKGIGSVGLWCYGYGVIANLEITPSK